MKGGSCPSDVTLNENITLPPLLLHTHILLPLPSRPTVRGKGWTRQYCRLFRAVSSCGAQAHPVTIHRLGVGVRQLGQGTEVPSPRPLHCPPCDLSTCLRVLLGLFVDVGFVFVFPSHGFSSCPGTQSIYQLALNSQRSSACLCLVRAGIKGMGHHRLALLRLALKLL